MLFQQNLMIKVYNKYTILAEVANEVLVHLSGSNTIAIEPEKILLIIPEIEIKNLQYLAGFVVPKLYTNFQRIQLVFFINNVVQFYLHACKVETDYSQTLINARDRGGLWKVVRNARYFCGM